MRGRRPGAEAASTRRGPRPRLASGRLRTPPLRPDSMWRVPGPIPAACVRRDGSRLIIGLVIAGVGLVLSLGTYAAASSGSGGGGYFILLGRGGVRPDPRGPRLLDDVEGRIACAGSERTTRAATATLQRIQVEHSSTNELPPPPPSLATRLRRRRHRCGTERPGAPDTGRLALPADAPRDHVDRSARHRPGLPAPQEPGERALGRPRVRPGARLLPRGDRGAVHGGAPGGGRSDRAGPPGTRPAGVLPGRVRERPAVRRVVVPAAPRSRSCTARRCPVGAKDTTELAQTPLPLEAHLPVVAVPRRRRARARAVRTPRLRGGDRDDPARRDDPRLGRQPLPRHHDPRPRAAPRPAPAPLRAAAGAGRRQALLGRAQRDRQAPRQGRRLARRSPASRPDHAPVPPLPRVAHARSRSRGSRRTTTPCRTSREPRGGRPRAAGEPARTSASARCCRCSGRRALGPFSTSAAAAGSSSGP